MRKIKHFRYKKKHDIKPRLIMFSILLLLAGACFALDHFLGTGAGILPGVIFATVAPLVVSTENADEVIKNLKNALSGFDLEDENTRNAVRSLVKIDAGEQTNKITDKLDELIDAYKNTIPKPGESHAGEKHGIYRLLTDHEMTSDDKDEKNRLAFNRYVRGIYELTRNANTVSAELLKSFNDMREDAKHGIQNTGVNADGAYTIPTPMFDLIIDALSETIAMRDLGQIRMTRRYAVAPVLLASGHPAPTFKAEATPATAKKYSVGQFTFGTQAFRVKDNGVIVPWTNEMDFDSIVDIGALLRQYVAEWFDMYTENILFRGNGQAGNDKITGLYELVASMVQTETIGNAFNTLILDDFMTADGDLRSVDKRNLKRYMSPSVHAHIKKLKAAGGAGNYMLDATERLAGTIEGKPVVESDYAYSMSESGANKAIVLNANLGKSFFATLAGGGIEVVQTQVATWNDGTRDFNAFQENLWAIRVNMPFDIVHPLVSRYDVIRTKA